jgi:integrase
LKRLRLDRRPDDFVFPGLDMTKHMSTETMAKALSTIRTDCTVHGFRSTFRDWVSEMTSFDGATAEAALAHVVGDKVEAAYRRGDLFAKRREMMDAWAKFCTAPKKVK